MARPGQVKEGSSRAFAERVKEGKTEKKLSVRGRPSPFFLTSGGVSVSISASARSDYQQCHTFCGMSPAVAAFSTPVGVWHCAIILMAVVALAVAAGWIISTLLRRRIDAAVASLEEELRLRRRAELEYDKTTRMLSAVNKDLEDIIQIASHDIKTPLVNVSGFAGELQKAHYKLSELLEAICIPEELKNQIEYLIHQEIPQDLSLIQDGAVKIQSLIDALVKLARLGHTAFKPEQTNMNLLLGNVVKTMTYQLRRTNVHLRLEDLPSCYADPDQMTQVFSNLISNALKYLKPDCPGLIRVWGFPDDAQAVYCVEDNGIGIAPDDKDEIFKIFCRLNPDRSDGQGLGLTIVRALVTRNRGRIWIESEPDKGSRFYVALPASG